MTDEGLLVYFNMVTVPQKTVRLERMTDYRGVRLHTYNVVFIVGLTGCL